MADMIHSVSVDYSQFYLRSLDGYFEMDDYDSPDVNVGLARADRHGNVMFTAFHEYGRVPVDIEVVSEEPADPGPDWQDVVELSIAPPDGVGLEGWEDGEGSLDLGLERGASYRVQYAVADAGLTREVGDDFEWIARYRIRVWRAPIGPPRLIRVQSNRARYWTVQLAASEALAKVANVAPGEKTEAIVRLALREHPDVAAGIRRGDEDSMLAIIAYAQKIYPPEFEPEELDSLIDSLASS